jgi:hypothetical protein
MRSPSISSLPAVSYRRFRTLHTSPSSSPYRNRRPLFEWMTTVESGSWRAIASNTGNLGSVEAILRLVNLHRGRRGRRAAAGSR